jgi:hypothetical protein
MVSCTDSTCTFALRPARIKQTEVWCSAKFSACALLACEAAETISQLCLSSALYMCEHQICGHSKASSACVVERFAAAGGCYMQCQASQMVIAAGSSKLRGTHISAVRRPPSAAAGCR